MAVCALLLLPEFLVLVCGGRACWGPSFGCAPLLLGELLGCVCLCARPAWSPVPPGWGCGAGVCGGAWVAAAPRHSWLGCWGVCVFACAPRLYPASPGWDVLCGRVCWARLSAAPRPSWLACWGVRVVVRAPRLPRPCWGAPCGTAVCGCCRWWGLPPPLPFGVSFLGFVVSAAGCPGLASRGLSTPFPSLSGRVVCCLVFFFFVL